MRRRGLMLALAGLTGWSKSVHAQQKAMWRIGMLNGASPGPNALIMAALRQGLADGGYVDGQNLAINYHWAEGRYVFFGGGDLVAAGLIASYARSGGNLTGMGIFQRELNRSDLN